jgi:tetratricopeptide (TPR) repeat protein
VDASRGQALSEETLKLAQELGDRVVESKVLWNLLLANLQDSNAARAIEYGERSLSIARALDLREQMAYTIGDLGWAYNVAYRFQEAEAHLKQADVLWRELGNMPMLTNNLNAWLLNLLWSGKYEQALGIARQSLEISRATRNIWNQGWPRNVQGQIWLEYGEVDRALEEFDASVRLAEQANTPVYVAWYRATLCAAYIELGALEQGLALYHSTRVPNEAVPMSPGRTVTLVGYALCEIATGQLDLAASTLDACRLTNSVWDYALKLARCRLALARQDPTQALAIADGVVQDSRQFALGQYLPEALFLKARSHWMNGDRDATLRTLDDARLAAEVIGSRRLLWRIFALLAEADSNPERSAAWKARARETVDFLADHMTRDGLRSLFLQSPAARSILT